MISYQQQINDLEQHIGIMNNPTTLTAQGFLYSNFRQV